MRSVSQVDREIKKILDVQADELAREVHCIGKREDQEQAGVKIH